MLDYYNYHMRYSLICLISIEVLLGCIETCASQISERPESLVQNKSLVLVSGASKARGYGAGNEANAASGGDMWAMIASLRGNEDTNPAQFSSRSQEAHHQIDSSSSLERPQASEFDWHMKLDQAEHYRLDWMVEYVANRITFALTINQTTSNFRQGADTFALGFSQYGQLESSDFCIIWYDLGHQIHLQDARTDSSNRLELIDSSSSQAQQQQFCKLVSVSSSSNQLNHNHHHHHHRHHYYYHHHQRQHQPKKFKGTPRENSQNEIADKEEEEKWQNRGHPSENKDSIEIVFTRPLDTCSTNSYTIDNGTTHLVWFSLRGPLLSIDGLNLTELLLPAPPPTKSKGTGKGDGDGDPMAAESGHSSHKASTAGADEAEGSHQSGNGNEFGMKRVQLIASKLEAPPLPIGSKSSSRSLDSSQLQHALDVRMDKFEIPAKETTYWCRLAKLPHKFELRRYHITKFEAVIEQANEHVVHHMELFNCANLDANQERELDQLYHGAGGSWAGDCNGPSRPKATNSCRRVILAWAMGAHPLEYPEQVGQSIGGHGYSPYVVLEVHYNNVNSSPGLVDSSGLRFHYTSKLRAYDAGVLEVGLEYTDKNSIPPNMITPIAGHCVSECTRVAMSGHHLEPPDWSHRATSKTGKVAVVRNEKLAELPAIGQSVSNEHEQEQQQQQQQRQYETEAEQTSKLPNLKPGIYIFAAQMHTHLTGVASWTEHVRGGKLLAELQRDNHYSPHFQEIRLLPEPVHVAPGDALIHYCLYDTTKRINITLGGYATSDEMCVTYLHYYPRIDLEVCKSSVDTSALEAYFRYLAKEEGQQTSKQLLEQLTSATDDDAAAAAASGLDQQDVRLAGAETEGLARAKSVSENYRSVEWSRRRSQELVEFYANAPLSIQCNRSNGERYPGEWHGIEPTRLWPDLKEEEEAHLKPAHLNGVMGAPPYCKLEAPRGSQLVEYRGRYFKRRHAQCASGLGWGAALASGGAIDAIDSGPQHLLD